MSIHNVNIQTVSSRFLARIAIWNGLLFGDNAPASLMRVDAEQFNLASHDTTLDWAEAMADESIEKGTSFYFVELMEKLATFAWNGTWNSTGMHLTDAIHESLVIRNVLMNREAFEHPDGEDLLHIEDADMALLLKVQHAAHARWAIHEGFDVKLPELAALAGVSDKTIRMAANPRKKHALVTRTVDKRTVVSPDDALTWLRRRPDYRETRLFVEASIPMDFSTAESMGASLKQQRLAKGSSLENVADSAKLSDAERQEYTYLEKGNLNPKSRLYALPTLLQLAEALDIEDVRSFVSGLSALALHAAADLEVSRRVNAIGSNS